MTAYLVYDVFTDTPYQGNQLAVIPDATALPEDRLQPITREFGYSETVFLYPPAEPDHTARLRIFTPTMEVPFAGHPTIGAAVALAELGRAGEMVLELGIGPLRARAGGGAATFTNETPLEILAEPDPALVARALGVPPEAISTAVHVPTMASVGLAFTLTELTGPEVLAACRPDVAAFRQGAGLFPAGLDFPQFAYVRQGTGIEARMFAPLDDMPEDPATGSACAALAAFLRQREGRDLALQVTQGRQMGRTSRIDVAASKNAVSVSGRAVRVMEGRLV